jgi:AraC-like DNA-binding protein/CheY-like chemotaxis protein
MGVRRLCVVVIADDERLDREFAKRVAISIRETIEIVECDCIQSAIDVCLSAKPQVVVLDRGASAGVGDGFEAARIISSGSGGTAILMTAWNEGDIGEYETLPLSSSMNIDEYLLKPIHPMKMKEALSKYLVTVDDCGSYGAYGERALSHPGMSREIARAMSHIDGNFKKEMSLESVAAYISISASYFSRMFKKEVGVNFLQYLTKKRLEYAKQMIAQTDRSMLEIAIEAGFNEQNYFGKVFKRYTGQTPLEYKRDVSVSLRPPAEEGKREGK